MTGLEKVKKVSDEMKFMVSNGTMATNRTDQANDYSVFSNDIDNAAEEIRREFEDKDAEIANLKKAKGGARWRVNLKSRRSCGRPSARWQFGSSTVIGALKTNAPHTPRP